jgi:hypothetical protein
VGRPIEQLEVALSRYLRNDHVESRFGLVVGLMPRYRWVKKRAAGILRYRKLVA